MTDQEKRLLEDKFLRNELTTEEAARYAEALRSDDEYLAQNRFNAAFTAAQQRQRMKDFEQGYQRAEHKRKLIRYLLPTITVLVVLSLLTYLYFRKQTIAATFSTEETIALLDRTVSNQREKRLLDISAGEGDWQNELIAALKDPDRYSVALAIIQQDLNQIGPCKDYRLEFFAAVVQLYFKQNPEYAAPGLECVINGTQNVRYQPELDLALIVLKLSKGQTAEAQSILSTSQLNYEDLPDFVRPYLVSGSER